MREVYVAVTNPCKNVSSANVESGGTVIHRDTHCGKEVA